MQTKPIKTIGLLLFGALFLYFSNGRSSFSLAAWIFPILFLQVSRNEKKIFSSLIIPLIFGICSQLSFWKFTYDNASSFLFYIPLVGGFVYGLLFYLDRLLYSKLNGFVVTLAFPLAYTSLDFLLNLLNPFGTTGILGYSQFDFLPFSQLASLTGMWGMTFMITWFGSVACWLFDTYSLKKSRIKGAVIYLSLLAIILAYGTLRLNISMRNSSVKISGIHTHDKNVEGNQMHVALDKNNIEAFKKISDIIVQRLIKETKVQAKAGSKIIVWSEISPKILKNNEDSFVNIFKALARQENIYLLTTPFSVTTDGSLSENKILLFAPNGELVLKHLKYGGNFIEGTVEGDKTIKTISTPYGKISALICWDGDFPSIVKQVGKSKADILLIPASDWKELDPLHTIVAVFRGIENGCSVVRQTRNGLSIITDPTGKIISQLDHFSNSSWIMTGEVPNKKLWTLYPIIGDLFGWLAIIGFGIILLCTLYKSKQTG